MPCYYFFFSVISLIVAFALHIPRLSVENAQTPVKHDEDCGNCRKTPVQGKVNMSCQHEVLLEISVDPVSTGFLLEFLNPAVPVLQYLHESVQAHFKEGVEHHEDHPDIHHLDVGSHWKRLNYSNKTIKIRFGQIFRNNI